MCRARASRRTSAGVEADVGQRELTVVEGLSQTGAPARQASEPERGDADVHPSASADPVADGLGDLMPCRSVLEPAPRAARVDLEEHELVAGVEQVDGRDVAVRADGARASTRPRRRRAARPGSTSIVSGACAAASSRRLAQREGDAAGADDEHPQLAVVLDHLLNEQRRRLRRECASRFALDAGRDRDAASRRRAR